jgi:hypothetical protein
MRQRTAAGIDDAVLDCSTYRRLFDSGPAARQQGSLGISLWPGSVPGDAMTFCCRTIAVAVTSA